MLGFTRHYWYSLRMIPQKELQRHIAWCAIGPTTLRRMCPPGGRRAVCKWLSEASLEPLRDDDLTATNDVWTRNICDKTRIPWGASRKSINLFLRDLAYNWHMRQIFCLGAKESELEVPLDSKVMTALRRQAATDLPMCSVVDLNPALSECYQRAAEEEARRRGIARVHLDLLYWAADPAVSVA